MTWLHGWLGGLLIGLGAVALTGCTSSRTANLGGTATPGAPMAELEPEGPRLARAQVPEPSTPALKPSAVLPTAPPEGLAPAANPLSPAAQPGSGTQQVAALLESSKVRVKVSAWVNHRPIFEDELAQIIAPALRDLVKLPEPQRSEKIAEMFNNVRERVIDQEVMYQDAIRKLEKNKTAMTKLKEMVDQEFEKRLKKMREVGVTEEQINEFRPVAYRLMQRELISTEYAQSRIHGDVQQRVTLDVIKTYYDEHKNEFLTMDKVEWQDVFIAVGPKHPTLADARRFAQELIAKCRTPEDFAKVQAYDDGDSKFRGGDGMGQRRGEIRPAELEPYLFELKEGQIGPVVELATGVHIFRLSKREYAGTMPMNDQIQKQIRRKLEGQIIDREYRQLAHDLRSRSVIVIVREGLDR
jgi:hypothetical protein